MVIDMNDTALLCGQRTKRGWNQGTASGRPFYALDPQEEDIRIEDIAAHLARLCRFGGAIRDDIDHYSVAQHSVLVSQNVPESCALEGLLHDAAEAYCGDLIKPVKLFVRDYEYVEKGIDAVIRKKFGLPYYMSPAVKKADFRAIATEQRDIQPENAGVDWGPLPEPWPEKIVPLPARAARNLFLNRFMELQK